MSNQASLGDIGGNKSDKKEKSEKVDTSNKDKEVFAPTELGRTPEDWTATKLIDAAADDSSAMVDGPFGSDLKSDEYVPDGYARLIQLQNIREGKFVDENKEYITKEKFEELQRHAAYPGEIAIAKMAAPVARACIIPNIEDTYVVVADCMKLTLDSENYNPYFVMSALNSNRVWKQAYARATGSTRVRINLTQLKQVKIPDPELDEQRRIASVLYNVDQAISKTEEIIEQTQRVKKGLMQDLFTEGYYTHEETKMTPVGEVPADWNLKNISEIGKIINGSTFPEEEQGESEGVPFIKVSDTNKTDKYASHAENFITRNRADEINVRILPENSVILPKRGAAILTNKRRLLPQDSAIDNNQIGVYAEEINNTYLYHYLCTVDMERYAQKGAVASLNKSTLAKIKVPVPEKDEQKKIANSLDSLDKKISQLKEEKEQLQRLKKGLMQDLLTGEVRTNEDVEVLDEVVEAEG